MGDEAAARGEFGAGWRQAALGLVLAVVCLGAWACPARATSTTSDDAVAFRENPKHTGALEDATLRPPLRKRFSRDLGRQTFFALIAEGKIFVWVATDSGQQGVLALDPQTGNTVWSRLYPSVEGYSLYDSPLAYDNGRLFYVAWDGTVRALSAATGSVLWETDLSGSDFFAPTASGGNVYVTGEGSGTDRIWALDQSSGEALWSRGETCCNFGLTPAVDSTRVYVLSQCAGFAYRPTDGSPVWTYGPNCIGGGGSTPAVYNGRVYFGYRTVGYVLDSSSGKELNTPYSLAAPTLAFGEAVHVEGYSKLVARDPATRSIHWSFDADSDIEYPPVAIGTDLYAVSEQGTLYALELHTGTLNWSGSIGHSTDNAEFRPYTSLTAGEGILAVTATDTLDVFEPVNAAPETLDTTITQAPDSRTAQRDASFEFESSDPTAGFQCRLDQQAAWEGCSSPRTYSDLPDGEHTFHVRAVTNEAVDPTPAQATWTIDTDGQESPNTVAALKGKTVRGNAESLREDDDDFFVVKSRSEKLAWRAEFNHVPNGLRTLELAYKGSNSHACNQKLKLFNYRAGSFETVDERTVALEQQINVDDSDLEGQPDDYVSGASGDGKLLVKVVCSGGSNVSYGDLMRVTFEQNS